MTQHSQSISYNKYFIVILYIHYTLNIFQKYLSFSVLDDYALDPGQSFQQIKFELCD